ncbi:hypothetical protein ACXIZN_15750 [Amycolatopsis sp. TRM77291]
MEAEQECVEDGVVATATGGGVDVVEFGGGERAAWAGESAGFGDAVGGAGRGGDEVVGDGAVEDRAGGRDDVFAGVSAVAGVAASSGVGGGVVLHRLDVGGGDLVEAPVAPGCGHACPIVAVGAGGSGACGGDDLGEVVGQGGDAGCLGWFVL